MKQENLNKIRRKNAMIYPLYKMFSWDLLFFYSIEFLFCMITKQVTASQLLIVNGLYMVFKVIGQIPAVAITDFLGSCSYCVARNF